MVAEVVARGRVPLEVDQAWSRIAAAAGDGAEGIAAFVDKRPPHFTWSGHDGE